MLQEHAEQLQEVCKLLFHVSPTDNLQAIARSCESRTCLNWPQLLSAFQSLCFHPGSKKTTDNFNMIADEWLSLCSEVYHLSVDVRELLKIPFSSLRRYPPPSSTGHLSPYPPKRVTIQDRATNDHLLPSAQHQMPPVSYCERNPYYSPPVAIAEGQQAPQQQMRDHSLPEDQQVSGAVGGQEPADGWPDTKDNDVVKRARAMTDMALSMYEFTRGAGELKTTQDLFTQAEFFAEEANKFYKVVRHFTYQVREARDVST